MDVALDTQLRKDANPKCLSKAARSDQPMTRTKVNIICAKES